MNEFIRVDESREALLISMFTAPSRHNCGVWLTHCCASTREEPTLVFNLTLTITTTTANDLLSLIKVYITADYSQLHNLNLSSPH